MNDGASFGSLRAHARDQIAALRTGVDGIALEIAHRCAPGGKLRGDLLDAHQVECFELAWAMAELGSADAVLDEVGPSAPEVDRRLAIVHVAEVVASVHGRLAILTAGGDEDHAWVDALLRDAGWRALRASGLGAQALEAAGRLVVQAGMDFARVELDEGVRMARDSFRRFAAEVVEPVAQQIHRGDLTVPESILQPLRDMGAFGLSIPEAHGGFAAEGYGAVTMVAVTEALSQASLGAAGSLITRPEILSRALLAGGTPEQQARWLPDIASGRTLCAIAMTEPDYGSDVASAMLRATRSGEGWRLDGAKTWCTFAGKANVIMVVARTDPDVSAGHRGLSVLLVEKPSFDGSEFVVRQPGGGQLSGRAIPTIGYRGMHSFELSFREFLVSGDCLVGGPAGEGRGFYYTMAGMVGGRMQTAARACGVMAAALQATLSYTQDRKVFGRPLCAFGLTLAKLARMAARLAACRRMAFRTAAAADAADAVPDGGDVRVAASLVKLLACRSAEFVTRETLQLHGGMGYAEETVASRLFVDARVLSIFEGSEETLALKVVARGVLEAALAAEAVTA